MSTQVQDILSTAKAEVGNHEEYSGGHYVNDSKYTRWYGKIPGYNQEGYGYPWCAVYVTWVAHKAGHAGLYPKTAGCATAVNWFKRKNRFSFYPAVGAQVFFGPNGGTHTGIVYDYDADYIYTYEGNTNANGSAEGDGVYKKKRARRDAYTYGYGYPEFAEGIKSADPDFKDEAPKGGTTAPEKPATPTPSWDGKSFPGASAFKLGQSHPAVTKLGERLVVHGYSRFYKEGPGPRFSEADKGATQAFQKAQGWTGGDADGYPGAETWKRLIAAPKKKTANAPAKSSIVALNSAVKPGASHAQVKELQQLLLKAGYGPIHGAVTSYYGAETQKAVARFHNKNPRLKSAGKSYDPAIGKQGFVELQKEAGRK
ncbi:peptidoglycan-binding protein [Streptomyces sp. NPDC055793]